MVLPQNEQLLQAEGDRWVTVYGFQPSDEPAIWREFQKCGTILQYGSGRDDRVNWTHIQFSVCSVSQMRTPPKRMQHSVIAYLSFSPSLLHPTIMALSRLIINTSQTGQRFLTDSCHSLQLPRSATTTKLASRFTQEYIRFGQLRMHLLLQSNFGAQRALLKSGQILGGRLMIGVKPLENMHKAAAESISKAPQSQSSAPARSLVVRPYKLNGNASQVCMGFARLGWTTCSCRSLTLYSL